MNHIYVYNQLLNDKINRLVELSRQSKSSNSCIKCKKKFENKYKIKNLTINESNIHELETHNIINYDLYEQIMKFEISEYNINFNLFNTNELNVIDGLYEEGSYDIYIDKKKNIFNSKDNKFSEHYGLLYFSNNKLDKIVVQLNTRVEKDDPSIYMPQNSKEALKVDYIFHTHPKTPYLGSRISISILYEFPSMGDILHFIEHHNQGILLGSIVIAPEGIYNIRKYTFNRDKIKVDYDIFLSELEDTYIDCYQDSMADYSDLKQLDKIKGHYKIPEKIFYKNIATNLEFIKRINYVLEKYDLTIDFYPRVELNKKWIFPSIYVPSI
jgi:hypothetical protein